MSDTVVTPADLEGDDASSPLNVLKARWKQLRRGDSGMVPIIVGLIVLGGYFQIRSPTFLSAGNLTNLFIQATVFILLGMAEIWLLLLGDIDLSAGWIAAVGAAIGSILLDTTFNWPWWAALLLAMAATTLIGSLQGAIVIGLKVPSFIITLGGSLFWEGVAIWMIDGQNNGGAIEVKEKVLYGIVNLNLSTTFTWVVAIAGAGVMSLLIFNKDRARRASGLDSVSIYESFLKIAALFGLAIVLVLIFNTNRSNFAVIHGMPYVVPLVAVVLGVYSFILARTKPGRYLYAIGGNVEAARRAGVSVNRYRLLAFALSGLTAGIAGLVYASYLGGISDAIPGGTLVLYAVAAAVIGGTSLFGGRGRMMNALIGGLVIATIYNGMALIQLSASVELMVQGVVLVLAIAIDSLARRGAAKLSGA
ncbi:MAG: ABC transporter permease [Acidimicrobiales bacterium]